MRGEGLLSSPFRVWELGLVGQLAGTPQTPILKGWEPAPFFGQHYGLRKVFKKFLAGQRRCQKNDTNGTPKKPKPPKKYNAVSCEGPDLACTQAHLNSVGKYGPTAFLYNMYGASEVPQAEMC